MALNALIKIGLVAVAGGATIATPIILTRNNFFSSSKSSSAGAPPSDHSQNTSNRDSAGLTDSSNLIGQSQESSLRTTDLNNPSRSGPQPDPSSLSPDSFVKNTLDGPSSLTDNSRVTRGGSDSSEIEPKKNCFVIPLVEEEDGDNVRLLICSEKEGGWDYYVFDDDVTDESNWRKSLLKIKDLKWSKEKKTISVKLETGQLPSLADTSFPYIFKTEEQGWNDALEDGANLMSVCTISPNDWKDQVTEMPFWTCGTSSPEKGIQLKHFDGKK